MYSIGAYFLSKLSVELPITFLQVLIAFGIAFPLMQLQVLHEMCKVRGNLRWVCCKKGDFMQLVASGWGLAITTGSMALALGCAVTSVQQAAELTPLVTGSTCHYSPLPFVAVVVIDYLSRL
jgi:hypothetical protein